LQGGTCGNVLEQMNTETAKTKTIVFVEDNPVVLAAYLNQLQREGFRVEPAQDGLEAMKILSRLTPDLVILDLLLPKFNGVEVLKFIHSHSRLKTVPVFILSTNSILGTAEEPVLERANKRLLKSDCTPAVVVQTVQKLFADPSSPSEASSASQSNGSRPAKAKTVVFVEDNPVVLMAYRNRLQAGGFHITPAQDGLAAMKILSRTVPDLVILDLLLPKFNGVDVLKYIQSNARLKAVPIIILSTNSIIDAAEEYVLERADKRLIKSSCTPAIMLQTIRELLSGLSTVDQPDGSEPAEAKTDVLAGTHVAA
jgi:CheY-like chemotaxis protein